MKRPHVVFAGVLAIAIAGLIVFLVARSDPGKPRDAGGAVDDGVAVAPTSGSSTRAAEGAAALIQPRPSEEDPIEAAASKPAPVTGIEGRVVTADGAPVAGARVTLDRSIDRTRDWMTLTELFQKSDLPPMAETSSDAGGAFGFTDVAARVYTLLCEKEGLSWERTSVTVRRGRVARLEIVLSTAIEIPGEVVDPAGAPVPGADVILGMEHVRRRTTDERGRFSVPLSAATRSFGIEVRAHKEGVGVGSETFRTERLPAILRIPLLRMRTLTCRFQPDDGSPPVPNARFSVSAWILPRIFGWVATTDAAGVGTLMSLPEVDRVRVALDHPDWCLPWLGTPGRGYVTLGLEREVAPVGDVELSIAVTRTGSLSGTVVDRSSGKPVPGLPIQAHAHGSLPVPTGRHYSRSGVTDDAGRFELCGLQRTEISITSRSPRWLISPDGWNGQPIGPPGGFERNAFYGQYPLHQSALVADAVVKVVESGTVEGAIVDAAGNAVDAADVDPGIELLDPRTEPSIDGRLWREDFTTTTDATGRFVLRGLYPAAECRIRARRPNTAWTWSESFELRPGVTKTGVRIVLPLGKTLIVAVVGPDGAAIQGADVSVTEGPHPAAGGRGPFFRERTGNDGCATFRALTAERPSFGIDPQTLPRGLQVAEGTPNAIALSGEVTRFTVHLQREILLLGKVVLEDGTSFGEGTMTAVALGDVPDGHTTEFGRIAADGSFSFRVRSSRPYTIRDVVRIIRAPKGEGASVEQRLDKYVPAKQQELRPGEQVVVVVRRQ